MKPKFQTNALKSKVAYNESVFDWFEREGRSLPWRETSNPYEILVSEVMLQQTQVATVLKRGFYTRFLHVFPDVETLARASDDALLKAWEGLGYYRRARMLRETARAVLAEHQGRFPGELDKLLALPGVGRYTAGALRAFAFGLPSVLVDGNVARVLARLMDFQEPIDTTAGNKQLWEWAGQLADDARPRAYHSGIMELGQVVCRPKDPDCLACPVARFCKTRKPSALPVKARKVAITAVTEHALWARDATGRVLLARENGPRRTGLWKLPVRDAAEVADLRELMRESYAITRYKVELAIHEAKERSTKTGETWHETDTLDTLAMAAPHRRALERLLNDF